MNIHKYRLFKLAVKNVLISSDQYEQAFSGNLSQLIIEDKYEYAKRLSASRLEQIEFKSRCSEAVFLSFYFAL